MGHNLYPGNPGNPLGFYEDSVIVDALKTRKVEAVIAAIKKVHSVKEPLIGIKSPELAFIDMAALNPALVIRTKRSIKDIARSLEQWQQPKVNRSQAYCMAMHYERMIDRNLEKVSCRKVYTILLSVRRSDADLVAELRNICSSVVSM